MTLRAPFPYPGGKRRVAADVWRRFGRVERYLEPFAGTLAVLLANPHPPNAEIVCDTDCMISNFWRALQAEPDRVAYHADWPTFHPDLTARHKWLVRWKMANLTAFNEDPEFHCAKAAGWWVWGISHWIGGGFCSITRSMETGRPVIGPGGVSVHRKNTPHDKIPAVSSSSPSGRGVSVQRTRSTQIPKINPQDSGGMGVSAQRRNIPSDGIPQIDRRAGGQGVSSQRRKIPESDGARIDIADRGRRLLPWFRALANRLGNCHVLTRDWKSCTSPTVLGNTKTHQSDVAIFMDPPYRTEGGVRSAGMYDSDHAGLSDDTAVAAYEWAAENGNRFKIAYCCRQGDFPVPPGWTSLTNTMVGFNRSREGDDMVMFSPACIRTDADNQLSLL